MIQDEVAISVQNVSKSFKLPHERHSSLKSAFVNGLKRKRTYEKQEVLKDISFEIKKGEFFGIVGRNGSGKSTLLKMLAGIYAPDSGHIQVNGKLTPFIELGVGFNPELTGRENIFLNGALLGFSRAEMEKMYDEIVEFAELEKFMDQKLKNYSSGMQVRLAFSIAIRAKSAILLLDEVLAVGDAIFQKKCYDYFKLLKKEKRTVVFVSHDTSALQEYCDRGILIEKSHLKSAGKIENVINRYLQILTAEEERQNHAVSKRPKQHIGTGEITVQGVKIVSGSDTKNKTIFDDKDYTLEVMADYLVHEDVDEPIYGITIFDAAGQRIFVTNNLWIQKPAKAAKKGQHIKVVWKIPNVFNTGTFTITPAVAGSGGAAMFDQIEDATLFKVRKRIISNAYTNVEHDMSIENNENTGDSI